MIKITVCLYLSADADSVCMQDFGGAGKAAQCRNIESAGGDPFYRFADKIL